MSNQDSYLEFRNMNLDDYKTSPLPYYFIKSLPEDKNASILDIGCGYGQNLLKIKELGYKNLKGIDISSSGKEILNAQGIEFEQIENLGIFCEASKQKYDFIIMSHVLEHIPKEEIIGSARAIKEIISETGKFLIVVPNAQSNTDAYWAYEDFTHTVLFTSGSIYYVLKMAGFNKIEFVDPNNIEGLKGLKKLFRRFFLSLYNQNKLFWNKITSSTYHTKSPNIYSFEIKVLVSN